MKALSTFLTFAVIIFAPVAAATPIITEFMAVNNRTLADGLGNYSDWIEIHNPEGTPLDLAGYLLADADGEWVFPADTAIASGGYLVVFASGREDSLPSLDEGGHLHTDFQLGREGESISLKSPTGEILSSFELFPAQRADISYGLASNDSIGYFKRPTPGTPNNLVTLGFVGDTTFSMDRGYYTEPFEVAISVEPGDATILYTTDGSTPDKGTIFTGPVGKEYTGPITIDSTTVLKAVALKDGWEPSNVDSQTYLFLDQVLKQPMEIEGYPDQWGANLADYEMDPEVVDDPAYRDQFTAAFEVFPTLSLGIKREAMFQKKDGIYQNTLSEGPDWERPTSVEFIFPDQPKDNFAVNGGIRIQGGSSRAEDIPKHSFSLRFREEYGLGELAFPFFEDQPGGETATDRFDYVQLRSGFNFAWTHRHYYQSRHAQYNRDQFVNDLYLAMGHPGVHGRWFHLYINGLYWGLYHLHERPDANYMAAYFGGDKEDYDAVNSGEATDGDLASWNQMWALARKAEDPDSFAELEARLNVDAFIDYMLLNFYVGNWDWDGHNWRAAGARDSSGARWHFFPWDSEFAISPNGAGVISNPAPIENALTIDRTSVSGNANRPTGLNGELLKSPVYKQRFADRVQKHLFNGGPLSPEGAAAIWRKRSDLMDVAIVAESARWGDYKRDLVPGRWPKENYDLYTKNDHYLPNQKFILETYLPQRTDIVLEQLRKRRLIGTTMAPTFLVDGQFQHGGKVAEGTHINLPAGTQFYTLDGTDPSDSGALQYDHTTGISLTQSTTIKARSRTLFGEWSPLAEAFFVVGETGSSQNLIISEIHYNPAPPNDEERAAGHLRRSDFEFIELSNVSDQRINLVGLTFTNGVTFTFTTDLYLEPGQPAVLVNNRSAFSMRYPAQSVHVIGEFQGNLRDSGEMIELPPLPPLQYGDAKPWPETADGEGYSLERTSNTVVEDPSDASQWHASTVLGGTPGSVADSGEPMHNNDYSTWRAANFTSAQIGNDTISGALADPDGDQRLNLLEYALGSSPVQKDREAPLGISRTHLILTQRASLPAGSLVVEHSENLQTWEEALSVLAESTEHVLPGDRRQTTYTLPKRMTTGYFRLRAILK